VIADILHLFPTSTACGRSFPFPMRTVLVRVYCNRSPVYASTSPQRTASRTTAIVEDRVYASMALCSLEADTHARRYLLRGRHVAGEESCDLISSTRARTCELDEKPRHMRPATLHFFCQSGLLGPSPPSTPYFDCRWDPRSLMRFFRRRTRLRLR
jgi:hypothetical protein